jgi:DNA-directed RNA polymerase specialized sigma24 family protein
MDSRRLDEAWESARRGRLADDLTPDEVWEFAWELVNEHNQLAAQHGARDARRAMKQEILALARAVVPIPEAARQIVLHAQTEGLILVEVKPGFDGPSRPSGRAPKRSDN